MNDPRTPDNRPNVSSEQARPLSAEQTVIPISSRSAQTNTNTTPDTNTDCNAAPTTDNTPYRFPRDTDASGSFSRTRPRRKLRRELIPAAAILGVILLGALTFAAFRSFGGHLFGRGSGVPFPDGQYASGNAEMVFVNADQEMHGVWIASVFNTNFPSKQGLSDRELKAELDDIVATTKNAGLNTIFFQVMPSSDALYRSERFPSSAFLTGKQGEPLSFDPLSYILDAAHAEGLQLHAWLNPFRVTTVKTTELSDLAENNPARLNPEYCVRYSDGKYYYNPALPEVRAMICDEVDHIVRNYDVDGIHLDDYFYPYPVADGVFDDSESYALYGGDLSLDDWRRENVNILVKGIYDTVKSIRSDCRFGISPFGIYINRGTDAPAIGSDTNGLEGYSALYCDALAWARGGYVDYLAPQIYWAFSTQAAPFDTLCRWWNANLDGTDVDLYIGHALYRISEFPDNEIPVQMEFARNLLYYKGSIFYGYADLKADSDGIVGKLSTLCKRAPAELSPTANKTSVNYPSDGYRASSEKQYLLGSSDITEPLTVDGEPISRTKSGYFSLYTSLSQGTNDVTLSQGTASVKHSIHYKTKVASSGAPATYDEYKIIDTYPSGETWITGGSTVTFSCTAPAGSTVTVQVGGAKTTLKATKNTKSTAAGYVSDTYEGSITFGTLAAAGEIIDLGTITFTSQNGSDRAQKKVGLMKEIGSGALLYAQVEKDYTYLKTSPTSSFYDDYTPTSIGMRDYIVGYEDGYYKLKFGGYVSDEAVTVTEGQPLYENAVLTAESEAVTAKEQNYKKNYTEIRFGTLENVPVDVWVNDNIVTIVLYDTLPDALCELTLCENPLFSSASVKGGASGKTALYTLTLKNAENYYGFNLVYESSFIKLRFNNPIGLSNDAAQPLAGKRIHVDAGHGGTDIGAAGPAPAADKLSESMLNLKIANAFADRLTELGATVYTTRTADETYSLYDRLDMIDAIQPDILVSVHHNSIADSGNASKARGYLGLYSNNAGILLADTVADSVCDELNRYKRQTSYQMLAVARDHRFPSTLCEMSFISNVEEFQWTITDGNIERSAEALANGVLKFFEKQEQFK